MNDASAYAKWLDAARRASRRESEAEDLLQDALIIAFESGRAPLQGDGDAAWFRAVLERHAAFRARGAIRSRQREADFASAQQRAEGPTDTPEHPDPSLSLIDSLADWPTSQRSVLLLALHGLDREEIRRVLDIPDTALRQRLAAIRKRLVGSTLKTLCESFQQWLGKQGAYDAGLRRAALARGPAHVEEFRLGVSDPDGHLLGLGAPRRPKR